LPGDIQPWRARLAGRPDACFGQAGFAVPPIHDDDRIRRNRAPIRAGRQRQDLFQSDGAAQALVCVGLDSVLLSSHLPPDDGLRMTLVVRASLQRRASRCRDRTGGG